MPGPFPGLTPLELRALRVMGTGCGGPRALFTVTGLATNLWPPIRHGCAWPWERRYAAVRRALVGLQRAGLVTERGTLDGGVVVGLTNRGRWGAQREADRERRRMDLAVARAERQAEVLP